MTDWESELSPIARERLARIGELTGDERERIADSQRAEILLSEFYQDRIDSDELWRRLKEERRPSLLREVQARLVGSLSSETTPAELQRRRQAILGIETLKDEQNIPALEANFDLMDGLQRRYRSEIEQVYSALKVEVERNPQLRVKQVQQGQRTALAQLTVDEAIRQLPQWQDFIARHEAKFSNEFGGVRERLQRELR